MAESFPLSVQQTDKLLGRLLSSPGHRIELHWSGVAGSVSVLAKLVELQDKVLLLQAPLSPDRRPSPGCYVEIAVEWQGRRFIASQPLLDCRWEGGSARLMLCRPAALQQIERRRHARWQVPDGTDAPLRLECGAAAPVIARLASLSANGLACRLERPQDWIDLRLGQPVACRMRLPGQPEEMLIEATVRGKDLQNGLPILRLVFASSRDMTLTALQQRLTAYVAARIGPACEEPLCQIDA